MNAHEEDEERKMLELTSEQRRSGIKEEGERQQGVRHIKVTIQEVSDILKH